MQHGRCLKEAWLRSSSQICGICLRLLKVCGTSKTATNQFWMGQQRTIKSRRRLGTGWIFGPYRVRIRSQHHRRQQTTCLQWGRMERRCLGRRPVFQRTRNVSHTRSFRSEIIWCTHKDPGRETFVSSSRSFGSGITGVLFRNSFSYQSIILYFCSLNSGS
jgi:hypothetical protein